jgi:AbrB family looped-hinge helix DNA binding protein
MTYIATITSKRQITLPAALFSKLDLESGTKVLITEDQGKIIMSPSESAVRELAGIIKVGKRISDKQLEKIIEAAKMKRFGKLSIK